MYAKKSFGQHFLRDKHCIGKILDAARPEEVELVLEVGPGQGALTEDLARRARKLVVIEADADLIPWLQERYPGVEVLKQNAVKADYAAIVGDAKWTFVSNLPYNAASAIIMEVLSCDKPPDRMVCMVQKEVGERMLAKPGAMSVLSVAVGLYADVEKLMLVKPGAFVPPPKVDSMVLVLSPRAYADAPHREDIIALAKKGFANRRKQLHRNFHDGHVLSSVETKEFLKKMGLREDIRAEELTLEHWMALWRLVSEHKRSA
jgi:16S rRNA (adenine1518-N6/adenine1519-N6)-dimethyltransferase